MSKKITLQENLQKLQNCLLAVKTLSDPLIYLGQNNKCNKANRKYLRNTLKNVDRLNDVIKKQLIEENILRSVSNNKSKVINNMFKLVKNNEIDEFTVKRDESFKNKFEVWEGNKYVGRFLMD